MTRRRARLLCLTLLAAVMVVAAQARGAAYPTSPAAARWHPDRGWLHDALCIYRHENAGLGWHVAGRDWKGDPSPYFGGMQFLVSTWQRPGVDGKGLPSAWSAREQLFRAFRVWRQDGGSWHEWGTAGACGLR